jgi:hypothetical protein
MDDIGPSPALLVLVLGSSRVVASEGERGLKIRCAFFVMASFVALVGLPGVDMARARPARIIFLRHGEKKNGDELCSVGQLRAEALSAQYLGKGAPGNNTVFDRGGKSDAFFAITTHTQETASPSAQTWDKQPTAFSVPPHDPNEDADLNLQTTAAAKALTSSEYDGKIVVVVWERKHIANSNLNASGDTLWSQLNLGAIGVPDTWQGVNYDYFWIINYTQKPPTFVSIPQAYPLPKYAEVPDNAWGAPADQTKFPKFYEHCKQ